MRFLIPILALGLFSCVKDKPQLPEAPVAELSGARKVFVVNEGNFGSGNAGISLYDQGNQAVIEDYYKQANSSPLGDVAQYMTYLDRRYFIVVNNSGKIVVCDHNLKKTGEISGLNSPRQILQVSPEKAYVSDLYANGLHVIDLQTLKKTGSISCGGWSEAMLQMGNKVFVTNIFRKYLYVVDRNQDKVTDSIEVGEGAESIVKDRDEKLWVLASGDGQKNIWARLSRINPLNNTVEKSFAFNNSGARFLCTNKNLDQLYFVNTDVHSMNIYAAGLPQSALIKAGNSNFYGFGIHPDTGEFYLSDALDFSQRSKVMIFDKAGTFKSSFTAGINANGFYFE